MINGIGNTASTQAARNGTSPASSGPVLKQLQEKYPDLKLSAQSFASEGQLRSYAMGCSGKYNVAIDPQALQRMEDDPEFSARIESILGGVKEGDDWLESMAAAGNSELIACGTVIDKDGNASGWAIGRTPPGSGSKTLSKGRTPREVLEEMLEKRAEEKKEKERLEERRDRLEISVEVKAEVKTAAKDGEEGAGGVDARPSTASAPGGIDFQA